jgi:predicted metal-dependent hydrolase
LKAKGYPQLADVEKAMERSYDKLRTRSLGYRLAYASGFETMTMGVTKWMVGERERLFYGADTRIASFILWHMVEEVEHKRVAFDVYQAVDGSYLRRVVGVLVGSAHVFWWSPAACVTMLKVDGRWRDLRSRRRLWRRTAEFLVAIAPTVLRSASPRHDPRHEPDPLWVRQWIDGYASADPTEVPLLDTADRTIPIPFAITEG